LHKIGFTVVKQDQLTRLVGEKTGTANTTPKPVRRFLAD
jgi:hypothetical protein